MSSPEQWLSLLGSVIILIAYAIMVLQPTRRYTYFSMSLFGGLLLLIVALIYRNAGLIFLEISWIGINGWGVWSTWRCKSK